MEFTSLKNNDLSLHYLLGLSSGFRVLSGIRPLASLTFNKRKKRGKFDQGRQEHHCFERKSSIEGDRLFTPLALDLRG